MVMNSNAGLLLLSFAVISLAAKECYIDGLPDEVARKGNVYIGRSDSPVDLLLSCKCSIYQPLWQVYYIDSHNLSSPFNGNVTCTNSTSGAKCTDDIAFIHEPTPELLLQTDNLFSINQSMVVMCYSSIYRDILIFSFSNETRIVTLNTSPTSATSTAQPSLLPSISESVQLVTVSSNQYSPSSILDVVVCPTNVYESSLSVYTSPMFNSTSNTTSGVDNAIILVATVPLLMVSILISLLLLLWIIFMNRKHSKELLKMSKKYAQDQLSDNFAAVSMDNLISSQESHDKRLRKSYSDLCFYNSSATRAEFLN